MQGPPQPAGNDGIVALAAEVEKLLGQRAAASKFNAPQQHSTAERQDAMSSLLSSVSALQQSMPGTDIMAAVQGALVPQSAPPNGSGQSSLASQNTRQQPLPDNSGSHGYVHFDMCQVRLACIDAPHIPRSIHSKCIASRAWCTNENVTSASELVRHQTQSCL